MSSFVVQSNERQNGQWVFMVEPSGNSEIDFQSHLPVVSLTTSRTETFLQSLVISKELRIHIHLLSVGIIPPGRRGGQTEQKAHICSYWVTDHSKGELYANLI